MKKLYPVLLVLILAALAVAATFWRGQNQVASPMEQPITDVQNQVVEPQPASNPENKFDTAPVSTADWKTYRGGSYEFRYPKTWSLDETKLNSFYSTFKSDGTHFGIGELPNDKNLTFDEWIDEQDFWGLKKAGGNNVYYGLRSDYSKEIAAPNMGKVYLQFGGAEGGGNFGGAFFLVNNRIYFISYTSTFQLDEGDFDSQLSNRRNELEQIVFTFKFTD